jgi:hypothetical protein
MDKNEQKFECTGDCLKCLAVQRQYCASQNAYNTMRMVQDLTHAIDDVTITVEQLRDRINAIQDNEALLFAPNEKTAQSGDGAEIDAPK